MSPTATTTTAAAAAAAAARPATSPTTPPTTAESNSNSTSSASNSSTNASVSNSSKKRKHEEATSSEKESLFVYASKNPQLKQRELAEWFELTFHKAINQSTVSRNLKKFKSPVAASPHSHHHHHHPPHPPPPPPLGSSDEDEGADGGDADWADVDAALHEWYTHSASPPSDEAVLAKATELVKAGGGKKCSASWLRAWKHRHDIPDAGGPPPPPPAAAPSPRAKSEEARRRREIKRLKKEVDKRDGEIARATGKREEALRRIEELETGTGGPASVDGGTVDAGDGQSPASEK